MSDDDFPHERVEKLIRSNMGGTFKALEQEWIAKFADAFPDGNTFCIPVLIIGIGHRYDDDSGDTGLAGVAIAGPGGMDAEGFKSVLNSALDKVDDKVLRRNVIMADGTSIPESEIQ